MKKYIVTVTFEYDESEVVNETGAVMRAMDEVDNFPVTDLEFKVETINP